MVSSFNPLYPPPIEFSSIQIKSDNGGNENSPNYLAYQGCSLAALSSVARSYGYELLQVDHWQAYYVQKTATHLFGDVAHSDEILWYLGYYSQPIIQKLRQLATTKSSAGKFLLIKSH